MSDTPIDTCETSLISMSPMPSPPVARPSRPVGIVTTMTPTNKPGEVTGWPKLQLVYRSDADRIADLLPPGITPGKSPNVYVNIYCVPVLGEPEYGVSTKVERDLRRHPRPLLPRHGHRPGGGGLHQPGAQRPAEVPVRDQVLPPRRSGRGGVHAPGLHVPRVPRAVDRRGSTSRAEPYEENEWWIKVVARRRRRREELRLPAARRAGAHRPTSAARRRRSTAHLLRDSPWDPYTELLPDARAGLRRARDRHATEPLDHARRRRSIRSRSGPTPTPSADHAGPANAAVPASSWSGLLGHAGLGGGAGHRAPRVAVGLVGGAADVGHGVDVGRLGPQRGGGAALAAGGSRTGRTGSGAWRCGA